jgi:cell wall assembly regulator SMI1
MTEDHWLDRAEKIPALVRAAGGEAEDVERGEPASEAEVLAVEADLGTRLPAALRQVFTTGSSRLFLSWHLGSARPSHDALRELSEGAVELDLSQLPDLEASRQEWANDADEHVATLVEMRAHGNPESEADEASVSRAAAVWQGKLPFLRASNGDLIAVDLVATGHPVCYLDHDHEEFHGRNLAPTFPEFMARWSRLGYVGPEWWVLQAFMGADGIDPDRPPAQEWLKWLGAGGVERTA